LTFTHRTPIKKVASFPLSKGNKKRILFPHC
jgi:hypothetical protein